MGCGSSSEAHCKLAVASSIHRAPIPDRGLDAEFEYLKKLGSGGCGDTSLYRERATGELVAIKLIKRPLPSIVQNNILREITVRSPPSFRTTNESPETVSGDCSAAVQAAYQWYTQLQSLWHCHLPVAHGALSVARQLPQDSSSLGTANTRNTYW